MGSGDAPLHQPDADFGILTVRGPESSRQEVRSAIAKGKESAEEYLDVHRTRHKLGGRSTSTMLFGHVESLDDSVDHLRQLRALQDETRGFVGFVPLAYQPENNDIPVKTPPAGFDALRNIAVSRIYLDNCFSLAPGFSRESGGERESQPLSPSPHYSQHFSSFPLLDCNATAH